MEKTTDEFYLFFRHLFLYLFCIAMKSTIHTLRRRVIIFIWNYSLELIVDREHWKLNTVSHNLQKQSNTLRKKAIQSSRNRKWTYNNEYNLCYKLNGCKTQWIHFMYMLNIQCSNRTL